VDISLVLLLNFFTMLLLVGFGLCGCYYRRQAAEITKMLSGSLEASGQGIVFFDNKGCLQRYNDYACRFFPPLADVQDNRLTYDDFINHMFDHSVPFDSVMESLIGALPQRAPDSSFREIIGWHDEQTGTQKYCLVEAQRTRHRRTVIIMTDISAGRAGAYDVERLADMNQTLSEAIDTTATGIIISNARSPLNPVIFVNNAFCDLAAMSREEVMGEGWSCLEDIFDDTQGLELLHAAISAGHAADLELQITKKSETCWFNIKLSNMNDACGAPKILVAVFTETTEFKNREARMFNVQKLESLGQLSAGVAHDFNNILSIIYGFASAGCKPDLPPERAGKYFERIAKAAKRGAGLTNKLMAFSRHKQVTSEVYDIAELIADQETLLRPLLGPSISLQMDIREQGLCVKTTSDTLSQILMNLVINARDAMEDTGGDLTIGINRVDSTYDIGGLPDAMKEQKLVRVFVKDQGCGIAPDVADKIFDPFFTTKETGKGTGLGLSVVYGLVNEIGGHIMVDTAAGKGACFSIYMPQSSAPPGKIIKGNGQDLSDIRFEGYTVLLAEDEDDLRELMTNLLEDRGMIVLPARDGNDALMLQEDYEEKIDLLLTDIAMPGLDGLRLGEMMHELRPDTPVIYMSGYPSKGGVNGAIDMPQGAVLLAKPLDDLQLVQEIHKALKPRQVNADYEVDASTARWTAGQQNSEGKR